MFSEREASWTGGGARNGGGGGGALAATKLLMNLLRLCFVLSRGRTRRGKSVIAGFRASRQGVEKVASSTPRATLDLMASQKVLAQLLTLTRHGTEEPQHRYASALRLRRTVPNRRDERDADGVARCHLLGFVCATDVSTRPRVSIQSAGRLLRRPITCGDSESWFEFLCARRPKSLEN